MLHDREAFEAWETALRASVSALLSKPQANVQAADLSDGSILSLMLGKLYSSSRRSESPDLQIVSLERKQFSGIFFSQLIEANGLSDTIDVVDKMIEVESRIDVADDGEEVISQRQLDLVLSECFFYQLSAQPVWSALSFVHARNSISSSLAPDAIMIPSKARIMCAALCLPDLRNCHGLVQRYFTAALILAVV
jgi:hypothetical protein